METALKFEKAGKRFGNSPVFCNLDLRVDRGCFFGLAGVNGAGKTSLIKCMLDFCRLDSGSVEIFGVPHTERKSRARLAYLPERFSPPHYLRGKDFIDFSLKLYGVKPESGAILKMLEDLDLDRDALSRPVKAFSKGMTQKLGLAACLLADKDLFVLDEPMSGLDSKARALVKQKLVGLKEKGKTLFFTSHSLNDMEALCDDMVVLHEGELKFSGSPDAFKRLAPENDIEAAFLKTIGVR